MIKEILLHNVATYKKSVTISPNRINYLFGSNGSGKTTISKVIAEPEAYKNCEVRWENDPLRVLVYNKEFREKNFAKSNSIKGIYTMGEGNTEAQRIIGEKNGELTKSKNYELKLKENLEKSKVELINLTANFEERCWTIRKRYDGKIKDAFSGFGTKVKFAEQCLKLTDAIELISIEDISNQYEKLFNSNIKLCPNIPQIVYDAISNIETNDIVKTVIVGKEDSQIGTLIKKLNNSDWVAQGTEYSKKSEGKCPFCQQTISVDILDQINNYFDTTYQAKCEELRTYRIQYYECVSEKIEEILLVTKLDTKVIDFKDLNDKITEINSLLDNNIELIDSKIAAPSNVIALAPLEEHFKAAADLITGYQGEVSAHNEIFNNIDKEKAILISKALRFIFEQLKNEIALYKKEKLSREKSKVAINDALQKNEVEARSIISEIRKIESEITSILPTITEINKILVSFGFEGFCIEESGEAGCYKIVRVDGSEVEETLSEGEHNFITFLYFYQLIKGSIEASGITGDKVIVVDDPVSSLDSSTLFIVSNLLKNLMDDCSNDRNGIKQIFMLTHNVYFHKEVSYRQNKDGKLKEVSFWIVRKINNTSDIMLCDKNPISTTYELLWRELEDNETINQVTVFNSMRRILECYFKILGGIKDGDILEKFEGQDKLKCQVLISWINDGSHSIYDDVHMSLSSNEVTMYLEIFKEIFVRMGHWAHYEMMIRKS